MLWKDCEQSAGEGLGKAVPLFERQYLIDSLCLLARFSLIVAQPLSLSLFFL